MHLLNDLDFMLRWSVLTEPQRQVILDELRLLDPLPAVPIRTWINGFTLHDAIVIGGCEFNRR